MDNLQIFKNEKFGEIRTTQINGQAYICLADVCKILEIGNVSQLKTRLNQDGVISNEVGVQTGFKKDGTPAIQRVKATFINESNLYKVIFQSRKLEAEKFTEWVTSEVLPSIRKHGTYMTPDKIEEVLTNPDTIIQLATTLKQEREEKQRLQLANTQQKELLEEQKPKVLFANSVEASKTSILIGELAKILKQNGFDIGQNRLFEWLRQNGYLISRQGTDYNTPTQKAMNLGIFEVKETSISHSDGHISVNKTTKVTREADKYTLLISF